MSIELDRGGEFLNGGRAFTGRGYIKVISDDAIVLELQTTTSSIPSSITTNYNLDFIWKSVSFDRMQTSLKTFAVDDSSVSGYIYHKILGHAVEEQVRRAKRRGCGASATRVWSSSDEDVELE